MIKRNSKEWDDLLVKLQYSRLKSNRDVLCLKCWQILTYQQYVYHRIFVKEHSNFILTSRDFSWEDKFVEISKEMGKAEVIEGQQYFKSPYRKKKYYLDKSLKKYVIEDMEEEK
mmetsp:Transcript_2534/g.2464  ORF Transcript_2534/g.2464 Transcript_2534/m.2464 type:complete len:114 (+) Transcript_2534:15-356(+)